MNTMLDSYSPKWFEEPMREAKYGEKIHLEPELAGVLEARGITRLYAHQVDAVKAIRDGKNIVLMAPTAAGKTECYMIPVVEAAMKGECSLLIFPTKALSRDQWNRIREFNMLGVRSAVYDGDTAQYQRGKIRSDMPHVIITNFDMLHYMLGNMRIWREFFAKLRFVVVDEVHAYSGTLGSHVANVLWRLRRVLESLEKEGSEESDKLERLAEGAEFELEEKHEKKTRRTGRKVQFIVSSATVGNALSFSQKLCQVPNFELIEGYGSPRGKTMHAVISEQEESTVSACLKAAKEIDKKTIIFANSHNTVERLGMVGRRMGLPIEVYRSGLPPDERRNLESGFYAGRVKMLAATSALELGMDVGNADAAILAGFPGTVTRFRQRVGRVGRKGQDCYAVLVARDNPLDQYYASNPKTYLEGKSESCHAKPDNPYVRIQHLLSAARDLPLREEDLKEGDGKLVQKLLEDGMLRKFGNALIPTPEGTKKVRTMSIRSCSRSVKIVDYETGKSLGEREESIAISELYPGAIYLIGGRRYISMEFDVENAIAKVRKMNDDETTYTQAMRTEHAKVLSIDEEGEWGEVKLYRGSVHITNEVHGYLVKDSLSGNIMTRRELDEPLRYEFDTNALWADWDFAFDGTGYFSHGLHALEHVSIAMMPALTGADPAEIGGISYPQGRIFYYEGTEGGSGVSEIVFARYGECIKMAKERLSACTCKDGCPSCIFSPQCGNNNRFLDKEEAIKIAKKGLGEEEKIIKK